MHSNGNLEFDQGIVVNNNDPKKLGRIKVRMITDGIDSSDTMHKGDEELQWYEPCILGAGYEVGSLTVPPVGSFVWCLMCKFDTENAYRVYLGSAYGSGPTESKDFNNMLTPPGVIETPSEALINYPYTQLLYKSNEGSYLKFYGDNLAGFDLSSGIPIKDKDGNSDAYDTDTLNSVYGDRERLLFSVSEMPNPIDKNNADEPEKDFISYTEMDSDKIFSGVVRDRGGETYNQQEINPSGIYMKVRGTGGASSPSENKEFEDSLTETVSKADQVAETATNEAISDVTKEGGIQDVQNKVLDSKIDQNVGAAVQSACKVDTKASGMSKKQISAFQERMDELAFKIPGGYGFVRSVVANAIKGNTKALTSHILRTVASTVFSLTSAIVKDTFNDLLSDSKIVDTEEASKFVDLIIGEANLNKLVGKASMMISIVGGKLGPFGQVFERVANTVLGVASSKLGIINQINNKISGIAKINQVFKQIKPTINSLITSQLPEMIQSCSKTSISAFNQALSPQSTTPVVKTRKSADLSSISQQETITSESADSAGKLSPEEEETVQQLVQISVGSVEKSITEASDSIVKSLISKTLTNASEQTKQTAESVDEFENILYLDADGARAVIPGEEISNCAVINNDGAQVHVGEECLFQMTPSNIMQFVSDPDYENQSTFIQASDGFETKINEGETDSLEITSKAEKHEITVSNSISESKIIQEPNKITLQVGKSKIEMIDGEINITVGNMSKIQMLPAVINVGSALVNLGQGVNLGWYNGEKFAGGVVCNWAVKEMHSVEKTTWHLSKTNSLNFTGE